jgi:hypothetical protein
MAPLSSIYTTIGFSPREPLMIGKKGHCDNVFKKKLRHQRVSMSSAHAKSSAFFAQGFISSVDHSHKHMMLASLASPVTIVEGISRVQPLT